MNPLSFFQKNNLLNIPLLFALALLVTAGCNRSAIDQGSSSASTGVVDVYDEEVTNLIDPGAELEVLGEGYEWSEGPVWVDEHDFLLFSDVPTNTIHKWAEGEGVTVYLNPSGYTGEQERGGEPGSNGLYIGNEGDLLLAQHGDRRIARMDAPLDSPAPEFTTLAGSYEGNRFNSPNDLVQHSNGNIYLTDPIYGLEEGPNDPLRELSNEGVYLARANGEVILLTDEYNRPNGIELSPDERTLYVAHSSGQNPYWMAYDVLEDGTIDNGRIFQNARELNVPEGGSQDGLDVDPDGYIYATGPGGVWIFAPDGRALGRIRTGGPTANCTIGEDGNALFITAGSRLLRFPLR